MYLCIIYIYIYFPTVKFLIVLLSNVTPAQYDIRSRSYIHIVRASHIISHNIICILLQYYGTVVV